MSRIDGYPAELFAWLASVVVRREVAWDVATGSGQAAVGLAEHFARVVASDRSRAQVLHARDRVRVAYRVALAEESGLPASSVDLVTVAAALHWFDRPRFYDEVSRVTSSDGVLAAWTYHVAHVEPPFDEVLWPFYRDVVGPHFAARATGVDPVAALTPRLARVAGAPEAVHEIRWPVYLRASRLS